MSEAREQSGLVRALGPIDATMIVIGSMIGSGIFITSAETSRLSGAPGWLLLAWALAGLLTMTGALCCSELATMMPRAGGVYVFSTMHPVTFLFYESWTGTGWRPKKTYFNDRPVPVIDPTWDFGRVKVHAPTYEYAHRTADLVNACVRAGLIVDGLWEWSPYRDGGPPGSDDALEQKLPAFIQVRARKTSSSSSSGRGGNGWRPHTDPPAPPPFARPPGYSRPSQPRTRAR